MRTLGIDPGYDRCGVAIAERDTKGNDILIYSTCLVPPRGERAERSRYIVEEIERIINKHKPRACAIETVFFGKNRKTAIGVAEVRGALISAATQSELSIHEYSPQAVKIAMTGYGASTKKQVADMVSRLVPITKTISYDDEFDAIAVALTHLATK